MKHCKGSAFLRGSVKSDPLDAWGEQSELEIEGGRLINPPTPQPALFQPRPKSRCKEKEETEKEDIWKAATSSLPRRLLRGLSRALCYPRAWILSGCKRGEKKTRRIKKENSGTCLHLTEINLTYKLFSFKELCYRLCSFGQRIQSCDQLFFSYLEFLFRLFI